MEICFFGTLPTSIYLGYSVFLYFLGHYSLHFIYFAIIYIPFSLFFCQLFVILFSLIFFAIIPFSLSFWPLFSFLLSFWTLCSFLLSFCPLPVFSFLYYFAHNSVPFVHYFLLHSPIQTLIITGPTTSNIA